MQATAPHGHTGSVESVAFPESRPRRGDPSASQRKKDGKMPSFPMSIAWYLAQFPVALATSTDTPGPMVEEIETFFM